MSGKFDKIKNYNISYENLLEASKEFKGFVAGLSDNDLFLFLKDRNKDVNSFIEANVNISNNDEDENEKNFIEEVAPRILDRTTGTYFLRDLVNSNNGSIPNIPNNLGSFLDVIYHDDKKLFNSNMFGDDGKRILDEINSSDGAWVSTIPPLKNNDGGASIDEMIKYLDFKYKDTLILTDDEGKNILDENKIPKVYRKYERKNITEETTEKSPGGVTSGIGINKSTDPNRITSPNLCAIVVKHPKAGIIAKGRNHLPVFFNAIPTIEMSRCTPYIDIRILTREFANSKGVGKNFTAEKFFRFEADDDGIFQNLSPVDKKSNGVIATDAADDALNYSFMDVFTTTQTFSNANINKSITRSEQFSFDSLKEIFNNSSNNGDPILEPIMPLLTLESLNISVTGNGFGLMSSKKGNLKLILHDRSRLSDIAPLVSVAQFATTKIEIEYGWNHPEGGVNSDNVIGRFLSSMKEKAIYQVGSTSYDFGSGGEVSLDIQLYATGYRDTERVHIGAGPMAPLNSVAGLIEKASREAISSAKESENKYKIPEIRNEIKLNASNARSFENLISWDELYGFLNPKESQDNISNMIKSTGQTKADIKKTKEEQKNNFENGMFKKLNAIENFSETKDGFYYSTVYSKNEEGVSRWQYTSSQEDKGEEIGALNNSTESVSLGYILTQFVGVPMASTCLYDEVQMIFYPLNHQAGGARIHTTASLPIPKLKLVNLIQDSVKRGQSLSVNAFLNLLEKEILRDRSLPAYGFADLAELKKSNDLKENKTLEDKINIVLETIRKEDISGLGYDPGERDIDKKIQNAANEIKNIIKEGEYDEEIKKSQDANNSERTKLLIEMKERYLELYSNIANERNSDAETRIEERCGKIYGSDGLSGDYFVENKFVRPNLAIDFEVIPVIDPSFNNDTEQKFLGRYASKYLSDIGLQKDESGLLKDKSILRLHIYDEETITSPGELTLLNSFIQGENSNIENLKTLNSGIELMTFWDAKQFIKRSMPTINYGSAGSTVKSISVSANTSGEVAKVLMIESYGDIRKGNVEANDLQSNFGEVQMFPNTISLEMMGMPYIGRGATIFIDFNTNTSLDNIYTVKSINHSISAGNFKTVVDLVPSNMGAVRDFKENIQKNIEKAKENIQKNIKKD